MLPIKVRNNLYRTRIFWLVKDWFRRKPVFLFQKTLFQGHNKIQYNKNSYYLLRTTLIPFFRTIIYSVFIIFILESFQYFFPFEIPEKQSGTIDILLNTIVSVMGIFLGLYFTAISSIASNFLIKASQDVRLFFLFSPKVIQYVQTIVLTEIIGIFYICMKILFVNHNIHPFGLIVLSILSAYIIFRFWFVGSNVFGSLEPEDALPIIIGRIINSIDNVTPKGFQWRSPVFQNHQKNLSSGDLELIDNLIIFGINIANLSDKQRLISLKYLISLLSFYYLKKKNISPTSLWYKTKYQHKNWNLASSTEISLALNTGTPIQPDIIKDKTWFEEEILNIIVKILRTLDSQKLSQGFDLLVDFPKNYGINFDKEGLDFFIKKIDAEFVDLIQIDSSHSSLDVYDLTFIERQGMLPTSALLGFANYLEGQTAENLSSIFSKINWQFGLKELHKSELPSVMMSTLEEIGIEIMNEKTIEGHIVSEQWYIQSRCFQQYLFGIRDYLNYIKTFHTSYYKRKFDKLFSEGKYGLAVHFVLTWIEFSNKYERLFRIVKKNTQDYERFRSLKDLPWAVFSFEEEEKIVHERKKEVDDIMVSLLPKLESLVVDNAIPDYFGQALIIGLQACYESCLNNDHERLKKIFPEVMIASISAYGIISDKVAAWTQEDRKIIFSTEPLINLLEISGYAKLYAELYQNQQLWDVVKSVWDIYIERLPDATETIKYIFAVSKYRNSLFMISPQGNLRLTWQNNFEQKMAQCGFNISALHRSYPQREINHSHLSPLIRVIVRGGSALLEGAKNFFFVTYLANLPATEGIEIPDRFNLRESIIEEGLHPDNNI